MRPTPWGDADLLRERRLPPGPGSAREDVRRNQRERLFAATVALVAEHGFETTTLIDISKLSGVSRGTFYEHFADKRECFLAALDAMADLAIEAVRASYGTESDPERKLYSAFGTLTELTLAQPAAAGVWFVESFAVGAEGVARHQRAFEPLERLTHDYVALSPAHAEMPPAIVSALLGGARRVYYRRLRTGEQAALPESFRKLVRWALAYEPPPTALRRPPALPATEPNGDAPGGVDQAERIIRAVAQCVAEKGYAATSVSDVARCAASSMRTFYAHFENKEEALLAALDWGNVQTMAAALPAFNRGPDWPRSVRNALHGVFAYLAREPALARAGAVEVYAAGPRALDRRDAALAGFQAFLAPGVELAPDVPSIASEAIAGAIDSLLYRAASEGGPDEVHAIAPVASYIALAPFIGAEAACEVVNAGGQPRRARTHS